MLYKKSPIQYPPVLPIFHIHIVNYLPTYLHTSYPIDITTQPTGDFPRVLLETDRKYPIARVDIQQLFQV